MKKSNVEVTVVDIVYAYNTDGGGMGYEESAIGFFSSMAAVKEWIGSSNPYHGIKSMKALKIAGSEPTVYYVLAHNEPIDLDKVAAKAKDDLRKKAMAKLTPEEREALGLK